MKTLRIILIVTVTVVVILFAGFFIIGFFKPKPAGIRIDTTPGSSVYINGNLVGKTPFKNTFNAEQISLRLVPDASSGNLLPYETKITLVSGIETVVRREFGPTEDASSGDVLAFEKNSSKETSLIVISTPDNAQVSVDGVPRGFSPYKTSTISPAQHQITVKEQGYQDRVMTVNTVANYQLTIFAKLAKGGGTETEVGPSPTPAPTSTFVVIGQTPTGFLRIRTQPGTAGEEIAQVKPGDKYRYLGTDNATGWYKIQYEEPKAGLPNGITGWVSNQFTSLATQSGVLASPAPSPSN